MKKLIATLACVVAAVSSHAQGWIVFNNLGNTLISTNSVQGGAATGRIAAPTSATFYFALFSSASLATTVSGSATAVSGVGNYAFNDSNWTFVNPTTGSGYLGPAIGTNTAAGKFSSIVADPANSQQTAVGSSAAQTFVILGWSGNIGSTLASVENWYNGGNPLTAGFIGESLVGGSVTPSVGGTSATASIMGTTAGLIPGFNLGLITPVAGPEPTTMALAGLGGLALLGLRRKK